MSARDERSLPRERESTGASRWTWLRASVALLAGMLLAFCGSGSAPKDDVSKVPPFSVYVGTYTDTSSRGIYRFTLDVSTGHVTQPDLAAESENPSFLALHPSGRTLYAVNELQSFGGEKTGAVSAFAINHTTGRLWALGQQPSGGTDPCHLTVDAAGRNVLVANYNGGSVAVFPVAADGRLRAMSSLQRHTGTGLDRARQEGPHAHEIILDRAQRFALAADLGADRIVTYRFDGAAGTLTPEGAAALAPGSGPRHLAWNPSGTLLYAISELSSTVTAFRYDAERGALETFQTASALPRGFTGANTAAEIAVAPDGRHLYVSNRGHDSIAVFTVGSETGLVTPSGHVSSGGKTPRCFAIDPTGRWLLAANQDSDSIVVFRVDRTSGALTATGRSVAVPRPVSLVFLAGRAK